MALPQGVAPLNYSLAMSSSGEAAECFDPATFCAEGRITRSSFAAMPLQIVPGRPLLQTMRMRSRTMPTGVRTAMASKAIPARRDEELEHYNNCGPRTGCSWRCPRTGYALAAGSVRSRDAFAKNSQKFWQGDTTLEI